MGIIRKIHHAYCSRRKQEPDPTHGDPHAVALLDALERGEYAPLRDVFANCRDSCDRQFLIGALLGDVDDDLMQPLTRWVEEHPKDPNAHLLLGSAYIHWAWEARGGGRAADVKTQGWVGFLARLEAAATHLEAAAHLAPHDPLPPARMIIVCMGQSRPIDDMKRYFKRVTAIEPYHLSAHSSALHYLLEKWGGSHEKAFKFARTRAAAAPEGNDLGALIADAHIERWLYGQSFDNDESYKGYFHRPDVSEEIAEAYQRSLGSPRYKIARTTPYAANCFAYTLWRSGHEDLAREAFQILGDRVSLLPWQFHWQGILDLVNLVREDLDLPKIRF